METLEIVFGNSCYNTMKSSKLGDKVLLLNALFNVGDLSGVPFTMEPTESELYVLRNIVDPNGLLLGRNE